MVRIAIFFALVLGLIGCGRERYGTRAYRSPSQTAVSGLPEGAATGNEITQIAVRREAPYGEFLTDQQGRTLYLFTPDEGAEGSTCYDACAAAWPPVLTQMQPRAAHPSVKGSELGTVPRADGTMQVTYNGWPLYYYVEDAQPGAVTGQDVQSFGGEWYLLSPEGEKIEETAN